MRRWSWKLGEIAGIGVYGLMASASGIIHSLVFFLVGIRLWAIGKRFNFVTQIQFFRSRFQSNALGYLLFPVLVGLVYVALWARKRFYSSATRPSHEA